MIRTLSLLSVLVAAALAVTFLEPPLLYVVVGVIAAVFLLVIVSGMRRKRRSERIRPPAPAGGGGTSSNEELGILEIRPKDPGAARPAPGETRAAADPLAAETRPAIEPARAATLPGAIPEETAAPATPTRSIVRIKTAPPRQDPDAVTPEQEARVSINHLLHALLHASGAHTVCLLREETGTSRRYHIEHIVSRNAYARTEGSFVARVPFAESPEPSLHVLGGDVKLDALRYYREELEALRRLLAATLTHGGNRYVLAADSMEEDTLATPRARFLLESTARMIEQVDVHAAAPVPSALPTPPPTPQPEPQPDDASPRPRREIIAEEMAAAPDRRLALALVHQHTDAEDGLAEQEAAFEQTLRAALPDTRIERFGEMTFGVFLHGTIEEAEEWIGQTHARLNADAAAPVSIGMAYLADRHDGPDSFRADATDALREAYESGQPVLVG